MKPNQETLDVRLRGREFRVACAPHERDALVAAVNLVDHKMTELAEKTRSTGESLALMTALNIAHELLAQRAVSGVDGEAVKRRISAMEAQIDTVLEQQERLF